MSKNTNDGLTRSGTGSFIAVPIRQQWASKSVSQAGFTLIQVWWVRVCCTE